jgi:hypothetical protein
VHDMSHVHAKLHVPLRLLRPCSRHPSTFNTGHSTLDYGHTAIFFLHLTLQSLSQCILRYRLSLSPPLACSRSVSALLWPLSLLGTRHRLLKYTRPAIELKGTYYRSKRDLLSAGPSGNTTRAPTTDFDGSTLRRKVTGRLPRRSSCQLR